MLEKKTRDAVESQSVREAARNREERLEHAATFALSEWMATATNSSQPVRVELTFKLRIQAPLGKRVRQPARGPNVHNEHVPTAAVPTWKSPVLLIHGDDDRTVDFHQTVDLERRLLARGVRVESLVLPDDVHDSLLWRNWTTAISAMSEFFERTLKPT